MLAIAIIILAASAFVPVTSTVVPRADVSTLAGPFTLVTTLSTTTPVVSTGNLVLYYPNFVAGSSPGLNLFSTSDLSGTKLQINSGVLGTLTRPDDVVGSLPYNATTPDAGGLITFSNQFAPHAGFDLNNGFLAIHTDVDNTFYLCPSNDGFNALLLRFAASDIPGCTVTRVALGP